MINLLNSSCKASSGGNLIFKTERRITFLEDKIYNPQEKGKKEVIE